MSNYPNFYPGQMQNMYPGYSQPMQNPYMDRMMQSQQYQQNTQMQPTQMPGALQAQQPGLIGKVITDVSMVSPNDVPMDGGIAIFPKNDMSEIYCKQWKQDGTIQTVVYAPVLNQKQADGANIPQGDLNALYEDMKALREEIAERFDRLEKSWGNFDSGRAGCKGNSRQGNNQKPRKPEVSADE